MESPVDRSQKQATEPRKTFDGYINNSVSAHNMPRYGSGNMHRGGHHTFNGSDFNSKRPGGRLSGHMNAGGHSMGMSNNGQAHVGSFSHNSMPPGGMGLQQQGHRYIRDNYDGRNRRSGRSADDCHIQNHAVVDGKLVRILQRPLPIVMKSSGDMADGDGSDKSSPEALQQQHQQQLERGHRKKTLSLNPEEREALENLVEEVIIGGLGEAIIDSDSTNSSDDDDLDSLKHSGSLSDPSRKSDSFRNKDSSFDDASRMKGGSKDSGSGSERTFSPKPGSRNVSRNNGKDYGRRTTREIPNNRGPPKDVKRSGEFRQNKPGSPEEEKEKPNAATVRGVNIYPAQLKVAIKHMDSLPPRFLRRLQTGSSRTVGNESILACLTMKSPASTMQTVPEVSRAEESVSSPTDRDRGKSKQTQLQETKKTIRNLLCDLDQYTDETGLGKDDCINAGQHQTAATENVGTSELVLPGMPDGFLGTPPQQMRPPQQQLFYGQPFGMQQHFTSPNHLQSCRPSSAQAFSQSFVTPPPPLAPRMLSCEELEREMLHGPAQSMGSPPAGLEPPGPAANNGVMSGMMQSASMQPGGMQSGGMQPGSRYYPQSLPPPASMPSQVTPKKMQFSVDAPEFVSTFYMNHSASKAEQMVPPAEPFYSVPPPSHSSEMTVQILRENVHMPSKPIQFPLSGLPPPTVPTSVNAGNEFVDMGSGQQQYQMVPYDQMGVSQGMGMMRNTPSYMAPVSLHMPPPITGNGDISSPSVVDVNAMPYQTYQYVSAGSGYNTGYAPAPEFNQVGQQPFVPMPNDSSSPSWMTADVPGGQTQSWYPGYGGMSYSGNSALSQLHFEDSMYAANPQMYDDQQQQMMNAGNAENWSYVGMQLSPLEIGKQKVLQLLAEGTSVMVILIGGPDGDKLSLVSDLPVNGNGALVLNTRNGTCNGSTGNKMLHMHEWNYKQVHDAVEQRKSPIIIDNSCAQAWEREQYTKLAEMRGYHVEIIDTSGTSQPSVTANGARHSGMTSEMYSSSGLVGVVASDVYPGQTADVYHGQQMAEDVVNSIVGSSNTL